MLCSVLGQGATAEGPVETPEMIWGLEHLSDEEPGLVSAKRAESVECLGFLVFFLKTKTRQYKVIKAQQFCSMIWRTDVHGNSARYE